jgi:hypothetical protein
MLTAQLDPRIGAMSSGQFYAFAQGYDKPETVGTLREVEQALGIVKTRASNAVKTYKSFDVVMRFEHPAWDEVDGISYPGIRATSKAEANKQVRAMAERDGHAFGGRGRYTFTATEI